MQAWLIFPAFFFSLLLRNVYPRIGEKFRGGQIVLYVLLNARSFVVCPPVVVCGNVRNSREIRGVD